MSRIRAYCYECGERHNIELNPYERARGPLVAKNQELMDWYIKHLGHIGVGYENPRFSPKQWIVDRFRGAWRFTRKMVAPGIFAMAAAQAQHYDTLDNIFYPPPLLSALLSNSNIKIAYAASAAITFTSTVSLASSSTKLAGGESASVSNTSNLYIDYAASGVLRVGTTPTTAKSMDVCFVAVLNDTPLWPDVFDGTDSAETVTNQEIKDQICKSLTTISIISTTSNVDYPYGPASIASRYSGICPLTWDLFVTHDMVAALNGTQASPAFQTGIYMTVI